MALQLAGMSSIVRSTTALHSVSLFQVTFPHQKPPHALTLPPMSWTAYSLNSSLVLVSNNWILNQCSHSFSLDAMPNSCHPYICWLLFILKERCRCTWMWIEFLNCFWHFFFFFFFCPPFSSRSCFPNNRMKEQGWWYMWFSQIGGGGIWLEICFELALLAIINTDSLALSLSGRIKCLYYT